MNANLFWSPVRGTDVTLHCVDRPRFSPSAAGQSGAVS